VEAVGWIVPTDRSWRDLPASFGNWNTVFKRYRDWVNADVSQRLFHAVPEEPGTEYAIVDATIVTVHRRGQGEEGGAQSQAIGRPKGDMPTKILARSDVLGDLVRFDLPPGQRFDAIGVPPPVKVIECGGLIADKAFDSNDIITSLHERGAKIAIS
jgi:hypothetical protein